MTPCQDRAPISVRSPPFRRKETNLDIPPEGGTPNCGTIPIGWPRVSQLSTTNITAGGHHLTHLISDQIVSFGMREDGI
jgi:hypothetical protein